MSKKVAETSLNKIEKSSNKNLIYILITIALFVVGAIYLAGIVSAIQGSLYLIGGLLGVSLFHAHYGFTSSFRNFLVEKRSVGLRAQMVLFLFANILFLPFFLKGQFGGHAVIGYVSPVGVSLLVGAFLFGIGMQMGDGCASGTLYHIGGGDARGIVTLIGFIAGSVIGSAHFVWWSQTPHLEPISFIKVFGSLGGLFFSILLLAVVYLISLLTEKRQYGSVHPLLSKDPWNIKRIVHGPWSWMVGSIGLTLGSLAVLLLSGKPWGVTYAFALWGAKVSDFLGIPIEQWGYWKSAANVKALHASIFQDVTTVLDFGVILGAFLALALSGKKISFSLRQYPPRMIIGLFIGGILMGYGARLAYGCNIGAYFSGVASFSLHGWVWFIMAMLGSLVGIKMRSICGFRVNWLTSNKSHKAA